jgi:glycosyltransferase involved in cell wall biosynthesis
VDDCTPDNSIAILKRVMEEYPKRKGQVRILRHERNRGIAAARNTALDAAQGLFICNVDSDDYMALNAIELFVAKQLETDADIVSGNCYNIYPKGLKKGYEPDYSSQQEMLYKTLESLSRSGTHAVWRRIIRLSLYNDNHIRLKEGLNLLEDCQIMPQLVYYAHTIAKIDNHIYYYDRTNESSILTITGNSRAINAWRQSIESIKVVENFFADKEPEYYAAARRFMVSTLASRMNNAARHREKAFYEEMRLKIQTEYADCYDEIGWDNPFKRWFACNFILSGFSRRLNAIVKRLMR